MRRPNMIIIGAPKTGTTSLHYYLSQHPEIYMSDDKEPHYFCSDLHEENDAFFKFNKYFRYRDEEKYMSIFAEAKKEKIVGEASTTYIYSKVAAKKMHAFDPKMKIIAIIRDPLDLAYSWYNYLKFLTHETAETFQEALDLEQSRKQDYSRIPDCVLYPTSIFYSEVVDFNNNLRRFTDLFSEEQCKFILYDDLKENVDQVYKDVLRFLDVDETFNADYSMKNVSGGARFKGVKEKVDNMSFAFRQKFYQYRNTPILKKAKEAYNSVFVKEGEKTYLSEMERKAAQKRFKTQVEATAEILNVDLINKWNYTS